MPKITFVKNKAPIVVPEGANLMESLLAHQIPVASSCHGDGICGKCRMKIIEGCESLTPPSELEENTMERNQVEKSQRLSCQIRIKSDLKIDTDYW